MFVQRALYQLSHLSRPPGVQICGESVMGAAFLLCPGSVIPVKARSTREQMPSSDPAPAALVITTPSLTQAAGEQNPLCVVPPLAVGMASPRLLLALSISNPAPPYRLRGFWRRELQNTKVSMILDYVLEVELDPEVEREFLGSVSTSGC